MKRPGFLFYVDAWQSDNGLGTCTAAARGVWIEMLCLMHGADPPYYGHLLVNGKAPDNAMIAQLSRLNLGIVRRAIAELESNGVLKRTRDGVIYSSRMIRDEQRRQEKAAAGHLGAEYGAKAEQNDRASRNGDARAGGRPKRTPLENPAAEPP